MNNPLKFKTSDHKVWFVSDIHAKHGKDFILKPRGFSDPEVAYEEMIRVWNSKVAPNDIVFNLGDFVVGAGTESEKVASELIWRLNGKQFFIWGNHNSGVKQVYQEALKSQYSMIYGSSNAEIYPLETHGGKFTFLGHYAEVIVNGKMIVLTHYPIGSWNEMGKGSWNIHGHCHGNYQNGLPTNSSFRQLDVGWEVSKGPLSFEEIERIMKTKGGVRVDHH
jgi:calcineurin-like phosphoesterase family protein